jgi:CRISPR-associated protein (TIGR02710 family)
MTEAPCVLFATVGGSHQPIVTAIRQGRPDFVVFFCTDRDPATGKPGSRTQIETPGLCIHADSKGEKPTLPNIPTQCALAPDAWELRIVPPDDMDGAFSVVHAAVADLRQRFPRARMLADYTGGTKTMTAALVLAALESTDVELCLVTGSRGDLVRVANGTQAAASASVEGVRLARAMQPYLDAWQRFAYAESAAGLDALPAPRQPALRAARDRARDLSAAFAAWDRFDHRAALKLLDLYAAVAAPVFGEWFTPLRQLAGDDSHKRTGLLIWDLWLNALRRAHDGRHDDAVARVYRVVEWTAQWLLEERAGLRTADLPADIAACVGLAPGHDGRYQAGLRNAWQLIEKCVGGAPAEFFAARGNALLDQLKRRNGSILAHVFVPIGADDWTALRDWMETAFVPMLEDELVATGVRKPFSQLPQSYPSSLGNSLQSPPRPGTY